MVWVVLFCVTRLDFWKSHNLKALNIPFQKVVFSGRVKCGGTEGEIVVAHGRLPSPTPRRCELKGAVRVFQVTVHVKKAAAGNAQITRVISKRCYIKYELDINIYNFENWLLFNYGFSTTKVHFHGHVTCVFLLKEKTGLNRFISKNDNIFQTIDQDATLPNFICWG